MVGQKGRLKTLGQYLQMRRAPHCQYVETAGFLQTRFLTYKEWSCQWIKRFMKKEIKYKADEINRTGF
ncbi:unnamed protein product [Paramecium sonneborni]|uniref:Uncharacterized protein n=1 Tax=Paramecium sonneborni TaxID=65129 RepID=A0A8S1RCQ9_9CILI|nr:unnamed protein product [Paramecium sonneborni]